MVDLGQHSSPTRDQQNVCVCCKASDQSLIHCDSAQTRGGIYNVWICIYVYTLSKCLSLSKWVSRAKPGQDYPLDQCVPDQCVPDQCVPDQCVPVPRCGTGWIVSQHALCVNLTCRTKLLEVVSEDVLPSERLKRLFLLAYLPWKRETHKTHV